jgi:nucleoid-associated protein YgaU
VERGAKIATAAGVFMAGLAVALLFRHDGPRIGAAPPEGFDHLVLRGRMDLDTPIAPAVPTTEAVPSPSAGSLAAATPKAADGTSRKTAATADRTASSPSTSQPYTGQWPLKEAAALPQKPLRRHRITDGDTLASLAQRYLGSADRANEIFELNRQALPSPELLPIGTEIKLPPRDVPHTPTKESSRLVPLPNQP